MDKSKNKEGLSRLAINLLIGFFILVLAVILFFIVRNILNENKQKVFDDSTLDLKISQVEKVDDSTLSVTVKRNEGEGQFVALSFAVDDGALMEIIRVNNSMPENQNGSFSLNFVLLNASKVKRISVTPIFIDKDGNEVIGNVKDEYITPNVCSNYCPTGAQCGVNDCGVKCGSGCNSGYLCLNYKCIREQSSSGGSGGGSSGGDDEDENNETVCTPNCAGKICGSNGCGGSCGSCEEGDTCIGNGTCISAGSCTCEAFGYECGNHNICGVITHCGNCGIGEDCDDDWACLNPEECGASWKCVERTCDDHSLKLNYRCGYQYICGLNITSGVCSYGLDCVNNWCYSKESCTDTCSSLEYGCGIHTICGQSVNCGGCGNGEICNEDNLCIYATCTNGLRDGTETGVDCGGICLDCVLEPIPGVRDIFYVAPWGDDSWPGNFTHPWETWQKVFSSNGPQHSSISPGDIVYFRGGVYYRNTSGYNYLWYSGTPNAPISFLAYPGERPILDGEYINTINNSFPYFVLLLIQKYPGEAATTGNFYFKGLEIRNFHDIKGGWSDGIHANGQNITFENIIVHSSSNDGISVGATNITLINCDFYNNFNIYNAPYTAGFLFGDNGNGVVGHVYSGGSSRGFTSGSRNNFEPYYSVDGVRTWNNSDGGFGIAGEESATINNTWVFLNGYALGDGDGWKGSYIAYNDNQSTAYINDIRKNFTNIISAGNKIGFKG